jgi:hypothetical protein
MFAKSHKWILRPDTATERRAVLRVREPRQTVMVWDKKSYDIDTCKFDIDSISTINSYSLADMIDDCAHNYMHYEERAPRSVHHEEEYCNSPIYNIPKFVPKDNDFEERCRLDEQKKQLELKLLEHKAKRARAKQERINNAAKEIEYQAYLVKRENELARERVLNRSNVSIYCTSVKNTWIPKI